jgi:hypothetical protein
LNETLLNYDEWAHPNDNVVIIAGLAFGKVGVGFYGLVSLM